MFDVGGVSLPRPFKVRRLGHFGFNVSDVDKSLDFYCGLLGFMISDDIDFAEPGRYPNPEVFEGVGSTIGAFLRHGTDHHSFAIFPRKALDAMSGGEVEADNSINQVTWQLNSMDEVFRGNQWLAEQGYFIPRIGRDTPGSNWHTYPVGPEGVLNELYCGMEQIGWQGKSKPADMYHSFTSPPELPHIPEYQEVQGDEEKGRDSSEGYRHRERRETAFDVDGILLPQPFKIVRVGPVRLFVHNMAETLDYYQNTLGLTLTESIDFEGHSCHFLRANTEHHSIALYPIELRERLGLNPLSRTLSFGVQLANYRQLRDAVDFLESEGATVIYLPAELSAGIDYSAFVLDPDGHAIELYCYMEQIGWNGEPRPQEQRRLISGVVPKNQWPQTLEPVSDEFHGEPFLGPWR
ncbi:extradiol dioxygenase [Pseudomaricurvus alkylphenolicus]|uniref:VOC family protein n=1 Tax=Pseudomaricurvus alkylphenolicus TaxID=1306991 RepID=UPI00141E4584|nr:VOC family protein [Pseudomaricurvus alkylphenolicus]NIB40829.1 extradiol dioxygenase [Pseudomaricurvus alkylphenolicus]